MLVPVALSGADGAVVRECAIEMPTLRGWELVIDSLASHDGLLDLLASLPLKEDGTPDLSMNPTTLLGTLSARAPSLCGAIARAVIRPPAPEFAARIGDAPDYGLLSEAAASLIDLDAVLNAVDALQADGKLERLWTRAKNLLRPLLLRLQSSDEQRT